MNTRIKLLRETLGLNQTKFGDRIGVKQATIAGYENGSRTPIDAVVASICREFNVNENWLRTGEGEMFRQVSRSDELASFMGDILSGERPDFRARLVAVLARLNSEEWKLLEDVAIKLAEETKKEEADW